jgi:hypothetical protein
VSTKLGTRAIIHNQPYEVVSILADGGLRLRPLKGGRKSDGTQYALGERVRIVGLDLDGELAGEIVQLAPIRAKVTSAGVFQGCVCRVDKIQKAKA